jgi:hypothetical protein
MGLYIPATEQLAGGGTFTAMVNTVRLLGDVQIGSMAVTVLYEVVFHFTIMLTMQRLVVAQLITCILVIVPLLGVSTILFMDSLQQ